MPSQEEMEAIKKVEEMMKNVPTTESKSEPENCTFLSKAPDEIAPIVNSIVVGAESVRLPLYQSFKKVHAAEITEIIIPDDRDVAFLKFTEIGGEREVTKDWFNKHEPKVGGYFVRYADGYESYSPADAFRSGYIKCETGVVGKKPTSNSPTHIG